MDAHALLTSQGWRGTGNSLHPTKNSIGLAKPLLVSRKDNTHGVGKKQHKTSDMWWMNAFDKSLQGLDTSKEGVVVQTVTSGGLDLVKRGGAKWILEKGGLYGSFVRGESLRGTITPEERGEVVAEVDKEKGKKRKREGETKEERKARKFAKMGEVDDLAVKEPVEVSVAKVDNTTESKEERRARRAAKKLLREQESQVVDTPTEDADEDTTKESKEERRARKAANKAQRQQDVDSAESTAVEGTDTKSGETKEERRERKRLKKLAKETTAKPVEDLSESAKKKKRRKD